MTTSIFFLALFTGATLTLPKEVQVRGTELRLDALAAVASDDGELRARLEAHPLGWAPAPGYVRTFQRWQLARDLERAFPGVTIELAGSETCRVVPETETIPADTLRRTAQSALEAHYRATDATIRLRGNGPTDLVVPRARGRSELRTRLETRDLGPGARSAAVEAWVDGSLYASVWVAFEVETWSLRPVLVRDVRRGEAIEASAVELRRVAVAGDAGPALGTVELAGAVALRDLAAGSAPLARDVELVQLVRAGDVVQIQVRKGPILARSSAVAREAGVLGQRIRVGSADRTREWSAEVVARGLVEVDLGNLSAQKELQ